MQLHLTASRPVEERGVDVDGDETECCSSSSGDNKSSPVPVYMNTSLLLDHVADLDPTAGMEDCCICMERKPEVSLPCAHSYCLACIEQW